MANNQISFVTNKLQLVIKEKSKCKKYLANNQNDALIYFINNDIVAIALYNKF